MSVRLTKSTSFQVSRFDRSTGSDKIGDGRKQQYPRQTSQRFQEAGEEERKQENESRSIFDTISVCMTAHLHWQQNYL